MIDQRFIEHVNQIYHHLRIYGGTIGIQKWDMFVDQMKEEFPKYKIHINECEFGANPIITLDLSLYENTEEYIY